MDETRQDILTKAHGWIGNLDAPNILWVSGHPGVGKSTIASTLVTSLGTSHRLGSSFFFVRDNPTLATPAALWCSVAYDLAQLYPVVLRVVLDKLHEQEVGVNTANIGMLFRRLIEEPLKLAVEIPKDRLPVVVVDALDECGGLDGPRSRHRENLLKTIRSWSRLPSIFKLIVTSRREDDIMRAFSSVRHESIPLLSGESVGIESSDDIHLFLKARFARIAEGYPDSLPCTWPGPAIINELTSRAAGLFIWATTVTEFIDKGEPEEQLGHIQKGNIKDGDLTALYSRILVISFGRPSADVLNAFHIIVGAIILMKTPLRRTDYLRLLPVKATMLDFICKGLQSVMVSGDVLRFNHKSFVDFLTDPTVCPKEFLIDVITQNETLALASLQVMAGLEFNICGIETSHVRNGDILNLDERVKRTISTHVRYSCLFWADHLQATAFSLKLLHEVKVFMRTRLLYWIEVLSLVKEVRVATGILKVVVDWCDVSFFLCGVRSRLK
jgi:hypothetical protein